MTPTPAFVAVAGVPAWLVALGLAAVGVAVTVAATRSVAGTLRRRAARGARATPMFGLVLVLGWFVLVAVGVVYLAAPTVLDAGTWNAGATALTFGFLSTLVAALAVGGAVALHAGRGFSVRPLALVSAAYPLAYAPAATPHVSGAPVPAFVVGVAEAIPPVAAAYAGLFFLWRRVAAGVDTHVTVDPSPSAPDRDSTAERPVEDVRVVSEAEAEALRTAGYPTVESVRATDPGDLADVDGVDGNTVVAIRDADYVAEATDERPLEDVSGVGPSEAATLRDAGHASTADLRAAGQAELAAVDGVSDALAARITADVGGDDAADEAADDAPKPGRPLADLDALGDRQVEALRAAGYDTVEEARATAAGELQGVFGVGSETVEAIRAAEPADPDAAGGDGSPATGDGATDADDGGADASGDSEASDSEETPSVDWAGLTDERPDVSERFVDAVADVERANVAHVSEAGVLGMQLRFADGREARAHAVDPDDNRADVDTFAGRARGWSQADTHDAVVEVLAWGTDPAPWLARPLDVSGFGDDHRPEALAEQVGVAVAVCDAVRHAGLYGTAHYSLSPSTLFRGDGGVQVGDWGVADALGLRGPDAYAAPEQVGDGDVGTHTTVYRAGATLFWLFAGRAPYDADRDDLAAAVRAGEAPRVDEVADAPADVADAVARAMDPDPARRYDSVHHLSLDVQGGAD
jgi:predicted flap endonuclease-1-like 5' DNA nuclease